MCALPAPIPKWPVINPTVYEQNYIYGGSQSVESFLHFPPPQEEILLDHRSPSFTIQNSPDPSTVKKLNHNASERDRRKKVNSLYSSLRSLLPVADRMKKLSFPATVSHALKYIAELQEQVERLVQKKEKLLLRISQRGGLKREEQQRKSRLGRSLSSAISINRLTDSEIAIQISMHKVDQKNQLSQILQYLEQDGLFLLLNATCFESFRGMDVFYNIHLQVETTYKLESEALSEKLLSILFDNREDLLR